MVRLGLDIGSKTIKLVLVDDDAQTVLYSRYQEHRSQVKRALTEVLHDALWKYGDCVVEPTVTGSAGMRVAELFDVPFVQEVVALRRAVRKHVPEADVILEMGGEDTKLVYVTGVPEQRMNTICAGGTGSFIEMMASLMGVKADEMNFLASNASTTYPIASRCAVFAKSDVRPLLNSGVRREDVAASVLEAVCTQAVAGLSSGRPIQGTVALLGGPFSYIPALRDAFCDVTGIDKDHAIVPEDAHLLVAYGAAIGRESGQALQLSQLEKLVSSTPFESSEGMRRLPPLFTSQIQYERFRLRHAACRLPRQDLVDSSKNLFIGIDAGSTTVKVALVDESGALCDYDYAWNEGDVSVSLTKMLEGLYDRLYGSWMPHKTIRRSCVIGYGEEYCKAAYGVDVGEVETVAHLRAAKALVPDVDFLMDIGGQDIKCFYVKDGAIADIVLNEACSSGCGSLFDSIARSMKRTKEEFAVDALYASEPVDLGTRCATFMDSRVKHAQKEGASVGDIAAGVCYSTVRNALYKVVRQPDFSRVGKRIVVQGGAFANDSVLRAFEMETGVEVSRPDLSQIMGAYGAALLARDEWMALREDERDQVESGIVGPDELRFLSPKRRSLVCDGCTNHCKLTVSDFGGDKEGLGRKLVSGNRCERGVMQACGVSDAGKRPPNVLELKARLVERCFGDERGEAEADRGLRVGIPPVLALYESYPFWSKFFRALGCRVVSPARTDESLFRCGMSSIPVESSCYPAKLVYGHVEELVLRGAQVVFAPRMSLGFAREGLLGMSFGGTQTCPFIENMPKLLEVNMQVLRDGAHVLMAPDFTNVDDLEGAEEPLLQALRLAGVERNRSEVHDALVVAQAAYREYFGLLRRATQRVLQKIDSGIYPGALVVGHGYHADPGVNHGVDKVLADLGYAVIEQVDYDFDARRPRMDERASDDLGELWATNAETLYAARMLRDHPNLQPIILRSFGCGVDAVVADAVHGMLRRDERIFAELKLDQIVDLAAVRIRLRSLAYANRNQSGGVELQQVRVPEGVFIHDLHVGGSFDTYVRSRKLGASIVRALREAGCDGAVVQAEDGSWPGLDSDQAQWADDLAVLDYRLSFLADGKAPGDLSGLAFLAFCRKDGVLILRSWEEVRSFWELRRDEIAAERERLRVKAERDAERQAEAARRMSLQQVRDAHRQPETPQPFSSLADRWGAFNSFPVDIAFPDEVPPPGLTG